jgi:hypothetical protein
MENVTTETGNNRKKVYQQTVTEYAYNSDSSRPCSRRGSRFFSQCGDSTIAQERHVHRLSRITLPEMQSPAFLVGKYTAFKLSDAQRTMQELRNNDFMAVPIR